MEQGPSEKLICSQLVKKSPTFMEPAGSLMNSKKEVNVPILSQINPVKAPYPTPWRSIVILLYHLHLNLQSGLFPSGFPTKNPVCTSSLSHMCHIHCPSHVSLFDHSSNIWWSILFMKLLTMLSSLFPHYLIPLRPKYLPQCTIIRHPQPITYERAICHNPHNFSNWDFRITRQMGYQHTFCQNAVSTKYCMSLHFCDNITCSGVGLLKIGHFFFVSYKTVYLWVMTNCFFRSATFLPRGERPSFTCI